MAGEQDFRLVYILGAGHCGSTLLNMLLNAHSRILGLSELVHLGEFLRNRGAANPEGPAAEFWSDVETEFERRCKQSFRAVDLSDPIRSWRRVLAANPREYGEWGRANECVLSSVAECSTADVLVDASKGWQRLSLLRELGRFDIKVVHLVRDGRAVANSYARKYGEFWPGCQKWMKVSIAALYLQREFEDTEWMRVRYEDLATSPERVLKELCEFIGVEYEHEMLAYRSAIHMGIGGNRMRNRNSEQIALDEKWRDEMPFKQRVAFALAGGWLNRLFGYN